VSYPILEIIPSLRVALEKNPAVILQAPPGAGKSTVVPLHLLKEAWLANKKMVMLEPRRLAARSVAMRMAEELHEPAGETVGYRVRFETVVSERTRIEVVTEGILSRMMQSDNALEGIGLIIFDEFHERSLQADLALALCIQVQQVLRPDLRILIMSATLEQEKLSSLLNEAPVITGTGKQFAVAINYSAPDRDEPVTVFTHRAIKKALREQPGDLLVFLPGAGEILRVQQLLEKEAVAAQVVPLFGDLPFRKQQEAILPNPQGSRKVVLATSIAETSLTIEGITTVIDSGLSRVPRFDPRSGLTRLETVKVTKDAADQRAGRAGRLGPGVCYRLWSQASHHLLQPHRQPEILEADLASLVLELANWGVEEADQLTWITPPPAGAVMQARELLHKLEALHQNKITQRGKEMLKLPTHPRMAHLLLVAAASKSETGMMALATDVAALLEERDPLAKEVGADLSLRVEALRKWRQGGKVSAERSMLERVEKLAAAWRKLFKIKEDNSLIAETHVGRLVMEAYPERIAMRLEGNGWRYKLANGRVAVLPQHDSLQSKKWLAIAQMDAGVSEGKIFLAAPLHADDLLERAEENKIVKWDRETEMVVAQVVRQIGNVIVTARPWQNPDSEKCIQVLCAAVRDEGLQLLNWSDTQRDWQARVACLRQWRPDEGWPDVSDSSLLNSPEQWLAPFLQGVTKRSELLRIDLQAALSMLLPFPLLSRLDKLAPARIQVPSGSFIKVNYFTDGRMPAMEVRLQEVFGLLETPAINEGRTKLVMHLLSPGYKPVQVTQDLKSFWGTTYPEVRNDLRRRYPKHHWPEDPWTADAVRGVKRK
jgi:ATP-dependent helicase HrpB